MKTAMQRLLDIAYKSISNAQELKDNGLNKPEEINIMLNVYNIFRVIIERDMLEREKEQIKKAYSIGFMVSKDLDMDETPAYASEDYYNQAYNQNQ